MRIVSLTPSLSETSSRLGLAENIIGCTPYCVLPKDLISKSTLVGGTKNPDLDLIKSLKPTHILTNAEENESADIDRCRGIAQTFECGPVSIKESLELILNLANFFGQSSCNSEVIAQTERVLDELAGPIEPVATAIPLVWWNPNMGASTNTYASSVIEYLGFKNILDHVEKDSRYPVLATQELNELSPQVIVLTTEPFFFRERHAKLLNEKLNYSPKFVRIEGRFLTWWGGVTLDLIRHLQKYGSFGGGVKNHPFYSEWPEP